MSPYESLIMDVIPHAWPNCMLRTCAAGEWTRITISRLAPAFLFVKGLWLDSHYCAVLCLCCCCRVYAVHPDKKLDLVLTHVAVLSLETMFCSRRGGGLVKV